MMTDTEATTVAVSDSQGKVLLQFSKPTQNLAMEPENARQIAEGIARAAYTARYGMAPSQGKSVIGEQKRMLCVNRATHIIRSMTDNRQMPGKIAVEVVDAILAEVT